MKDLKIYTGEIFKGKEECGKIIDEIINLENQNCEEILQALLQEQEFLAITFQNHNRYIRKEISYEEFRNLSLKAFKL